MQTYIYVVYIHSHSFHSFVFIFHVTPSAQKRESIEGFIGGVPQSLSRAHTHSLLIVPSLCECVDETNWHPGVPWQWMRSMVKMKWVPGKCMCECGWVSDSNEGEQQHGSRKSFQYLCAPCIHTCVAYTVAYELLLLVLGSSLGGRRRRVISNGIIIILARLIVCVCLCSASK